MNNKMISLVGVLVLAGAAHADGWKGQGDAGVVFATGNTESFNANLGLKLEYEGAAWRHAADLRYLRSSSEQTVITLGPNGQPIEVREDVDTADLLSLGWKTDRKLSERAYVFGAIRFDRDEFGPFDTQTNFALGYGYSAIKNEQTTLDLEAGVGYREFETNTVPQVEGDDVIFRVGGKLAHQFSESWQLGNSLLVESGEENTLVSSDTALSFKFNDKLGLKLGVLVRHNSDVPAGTEDTDTISSVSLVYSF